MNGVLRSRIKSFYDIAAVVSLLAQKKNFPHFLAAQRKFLSPNSVKVSQFQNELMNSSFLPKNERKIARISAIFHKAEILAIIVHFLGDLMTS